MVAGLSLSSPLRAGHRIRFALSAEAPKSVFQVPHEIFEWARYSPGPGDHDVILPKLGLRRHNTSHRRAQSPLSPVSRDRAADPPARCEANAHAVFAIHSCARRLQNKTRRHAFSACGRDSEKIGPALEGRDPQRHRLRRSDACAPWHAASPGSVARRRSSYGCGSRAGACERYCSVEMSASRPFLRRPVCPAAGPVEGLIRKGGCIRADRREVNVARR